MYDNDPNHKSNKAIEFLVKLENQKYWLASLFSRFKSNSEWMKNNSKKNKVKNMTQSDLIEAVKSA